MKRWKVILATLVIFASGLVTGGLLLKTTQPKPLRSIPPELFLQGPFFIQKQFMGRMKSELDLAPKQIENLDQIFAESRERVRILHDVIGPELREELVAVRQDIEDELTPEQKQKFEELLKHSRSMRHGGRRLWDTESSRLRSQDSRSDSRKKNVSKPAREGSRRSEPESSPPQSSPK